MEKKEIIFCVTIFIFLLIVFFVSESWYKKQLIDEQKSNTLEELSSYSLGLSNSIDRRFTLLDGLYVFVDIHKDKEDFKEEFDLFAGGLYLTTEGIRNFALAPNGIQKYVYPIKGNENVAGHDLINDERENVRRDVNKAIETKKIVISGPYELRQGGLGLISRRAFYTNETFWGLITMVIDMPPIFEEAGLSAFENELVFAIRKTGDVAFYGDNSIFESDSLTYELRLPDGSWEIAVFPRKGWKSLISKDLIVFRIILGFSLFLIFVLLYLNFQKKEKLKAEIDKKTNELDEKYKGLREKVPQLEEFAKIAIEREKKMIELKNDIQKLKGGKTKNEKGNIGFRSIIKYLGRFGRREA